MTVCCCHCSHLKLWFRSKTVRTFDTKSSTKQTHCVHLVTLLSNFPLKSKWLKLLLKKYENCIKCFYYFLSTQYGLIIVQLLLFYFLKGCNRQAFQWGCPAEADGDPSKPQNLPEPASLPEVCHFIVTFGFMVNLEITLIHKKCNEISSEAKDSFIDAFLCLFLFLFPLTLRAHLPHSRWIPN